MIETILGGIVVLALFLFTVYGLPKFGYRMRGKRISKIILLSGNSSIKYDAKDGILEINGCTAVAEMGEMTIDPETTTPAWEGRKEEIRGLKPSRMDLDLPCNCNDCKNYKGLIISTKEPIDFTGKITGGHGGSETKNRL